jgi:hypothetical protein
VEVVDGLVALGPGAQERAARLEPAIPGAHLIAAVLTVIRVTFRGDLIFSEPSPDSRDNVLLFAHDPSLCFVVHAHVIGRGAVPASMIDNDFGHFTIRAG